MLIFYNSLGQERYIVQATSGQAGVNLSTPSIGEINKTGMTWSAGEMNCASNGVFRGTATAAGIPATNLDKVGLFANISSYSAQPPLSGYLQKILLLPNPSA